jgi:broad specificity phosphatase PhoE
MDVKYGGRTLASTANAVNTLGPVKSFHLTIVRHGETHSNKEGIVAGQTDAPLSVVGVSQAARLGERFADEKFTHWLTSDLSRARDTAKVVMAANLHAVGMPLRIDARLVCSLFF